VLEDRRQLRVAGYPGGWYNPEMVHVAEGLSGLGVKPGDTVAFNACLSDPYWARLAGVRILTEIYDPDVPVPTFLDSLQRRNIVIAIVQSQGGKVLVGDFGRTRTNSADQALEGWRQLGDTTFYDLVLPATSGPSAAVEPEPAH
jgi:hypothetical protein